MNLIKFNPFLPLSTQFEDTVETFFQRSLSDLIGSDFVNEIPKANVIDKDNEFEIQIAAPGYSKEDFTIAVENQQLIISSEKKKEEVMDGKFNRREFQFESFRRTFPLHHNINEDIIEAKYENGLLLVRLPKQDIKETQKVIEVS